MTQKETKFQWTKKKYEVAEALAIGIKTQEQIANDCGVARKTIWVWMQKTEFREHVDKLTLENERATRAGILRQLFKGAEIKSKNIEDDKNTLLDYLKEIADIQGHKKQKVEHSGSVEHTGGVVVYIPDNGRDESGQDIEEGN